MFLEELQFIDQQISKLDQELVTWLTPSPKHFSPNKLTRGRARATRPKDAKDEDEATGQ